MDPKEVSLFQAVLTATILIGAILLYLLTSILKQQRINAALRKQNLSKQLEALDKDRARIAADLHDSVGPLLTVIKMTVNSFELTDVEDIAHRKETLAYLDEVLKKLNEISFNLVPNSLLQRGLVKTIQEFINFLNTKHSIRFTFSAPDLRILRNDITINLYHLILELVHNAIKHSKATEIRIELREKNYELHLKVSDNGIGFDFNRKLAAQVGNGLQNICNRAFLLGGKMCVDTGPGKGTVALFEITL